MACECSLCERNREIISTVQDGTKEEIAYLVYELMNALMDVEMDRDYYKSVVEGSWPNTEEIGKAYKLYLERDEDTN